MIVLASDYVGSKIVEFLASQNAKVDFLILHEDNKGRYNEEISATCRTAMKTTVIEWSSRLKDEDFLHELVLARPSIGILAWWPNILKGKILDVPSRGWVNFHPSYLPFNRGKNPNFWCLVDGTPCGVTLHWVDKTVDGGPLIAQKTLPVSWEDTGESVYKRSRDLIIDLFKEVYTDLLADKLPKRPQTSHEGTFYRSGDMERAAKIELDQRYTARQLLNLVRAKMFPPHPSAFFDDNGERYAVEVIIKKVESKDSE